jgi:acyl-CoA synthetase (AMP-forming)/AMP-acid ligase II
MIHECIADTALKNPGRTAVIYKRSRVTYGELNSGILRTGSFLLSDGLRTGDRVGILMENSPEYIMSYLGVQKAGGISVAINPQCSSYELKKLFNDFQPKTVILENKLLKNVVGALTHETSIETIIVVDAGNGLEQILNRTGNIFPVARLFSLENIIRNVHDNMNYPRIDEKDIAAIIYTSGTTGEPKGVMLSHNNFIANAKSIIRYLNITDDDRVMVVLPFCYSYGISLLTTHLMSGASLVIENSFMYPNVVLDKMIEEDVTSFAGVPSTFAILLNRSNIRNCRFPKLRYITQAGGAMSPKHAMEIAAILSDTDIYIMYGQTEATARLTYLEPKDFFRKPGSVGKAVPGVTIDLLKENGMSAGTGEEGEIVAQGDNIMVGYWNKPGETKKVLKNSKLHTGDLAVRDDEGYLKIISRRSDMIKSGAHRISPKEIEEIILEMPEVHEVAVIGREDEILGVVIRAVIVFKEGFEPEAQKVRKHCHEKLAPFKVPKDVVFVKELPKTASGKIRKHMIEGTATVIADSFNRREI